MKQPTLRSLIFGILLPFAAIAQNDAPEPGGPPPDVAGGMPGMPEAPNAAAVAPASTSAATTTSAVMPTLRQVAATVVSSAAQQSTSPTAVLVSATASSIADGTTSVSTAAPAVAPTLAAKPTGKGDILLNFQNASLADVLNYLSEAAGFVIVQEAPVAGTVNIVSRQPITAEDAVDLVNSVLIEKGYTAIRNGRILKIISRNGAQKQDLPVMAGSDPTQIPRKDGMVTQILPVRYVEAAKLVENLRPLLSADATISANEASNAILLADTQTNIHRMAEIIHALDTSVSSISSIHVYALKYADSKSLAAVLTQLFATDQNSRGNNANGGNAGGRGGNLPPWAAMMGGRGGNNNNATTQSAAQQASTRIVAVSDDQSNSVIVSAPEAAMETITQIVNRIDTNIADITETRIFRLEHADCTELSNVLNSLYSDVSNFSTSRTGGNNGGQRQQTNAASNNSNRSERSLLQSRVVAVPDPRTNSLLVSAARESMTQIAETVGRLDSGDTRKQKVFVHSLENADPDNVATILRGMFSSQNSSSSTSAQPSSNQLNQRTANGASSNITNLLNTSGNSSSRSR